MLKGLIYGFSMIVIGLLMLSYGATIYNPSHSEAMQFAEFLFGFLVGATGVLTLLFGVGILGSLFTRKRKVVQP